MTQRALKIDLYGFLANKLRSEVMNDDLVDEDDIRKAQREQVRLADELERRANKLERNAFDVATKPAPDGSR